MWLFLSGGFVSIIAHRHLPDCVLVRSRNMAHLKSLFPNAKHFSLEQADYTHRAVIERTNVAEILSNYVMMMKYDNFKNSISESKYFHVCHDVFMGMLHRVNHIRWWLLIPNPPASRDINTDAVGSDKVSIKANDFVWLRNSWSTFLKPWICTLP